MAKIPVPQRGRDWTNLTITGQIVATDGTLSDGTAVQVLTTVPNIKNVVTGMQINDQIEKAEVNAANTTQRHEIIVSEGTEWNISIFKVNNGTDPNPLFPLTNTYDYFKIVWAEGSATGSISTNTFYGSRGNLSTGLQGRGEQIAEFQLGPCDPGVVQWTRVLS